MRHACNQITQLASDSLDRPLSLWERCKLKLHLSMCGYCKSSDHNLNLIQQVTKLMRSNDYGQIRLSEKQRERLHHALENSTKDQ